MRRVLMRRVLMRGVAAGLTSRALSPWPPTAGPPSPGSPRRGNLRPGPPHPGSGPPGTRRPPGPPAGWTRREPPRSGRTTATPQETGTGRRRDALMTWRPGTFRRCPPARCRTPGIRPARSRRCRIRTTCGASRPLARCPLPRPGPGRPDATRTRAGVSPATRRPAKRGRPRADIRRTWPATRGAVPATRETTLATRTIPLPTGLTRTNRRSSPGPAAGAGAAVARRQIPARVIRGMRGTWTTRVTWTWPRIRGRTPGITLPPGAGTRVRTSRAAGLRTTPVARCCPAWIRDADPGARTAADLPRRRGSGAGAAVPSCSCC